MLLCPNFSLRHWHVSVVLLSLCSIVSGTAWLRYSGVSCDNSKVVQDFGVRDLESCKTGVASNGFGMFASWGGQDGVVNSTGHCVAYLYCDNPTCQTTNNTYHALRAGQKQWEMGCAADPPTPAPAPTPAPPLPPPATGTILPCFDPSCRHWNDTDGNRIEAHAAGMLQAPDGTWYWYGESRKTPSLADHGVNCYSAADISGPWKNEGQVLRQADLRVEGQQGPFVVERPKVLYNNATETYVMWFHLDSGDYKLRHAGVATSKQPQGPFAFQHALLPDGKTSLDMSLFRDPQDGQAYFVRSVENTYTAISRLTPDYLNSTGIISNHSVFEGMALFRHPNGTYYIITSHLTGWGPNPLMLFRANGKTLDDPQWVNMGNPTGDATSFNSQPTYVVQYTPTSGEPYFVYMADNWIHASQQPGNAGLVDAAYIWLPFWFKEDRIELHRQLAWELEAPIPPCPTAGARLRLSECGRGGQAWVVPNGTGQLTLAGSGMCATLDTASQQLVMGDCAAAAAFEWAGEQLRSGERCVDVTLCDNFVCAGKYLGMAACANPHGNQAFALDQVLGGSGAVQLRSTMYDNTTGDMTHQCVTACD